MQVDPEFVVEEYLHDLNPPTRTQLYSTSTGTSYPEFNDEAQRDRAAKAELVLRWAAYGTQVAAATALTHPLALARVLMELGYEPLPPYPSRTFFGKPCLVLPSVSSYVRFMKRRDGAVALWKGFGANFWSVLTGNVANDLCYHLIDEFIKRKIRSSPRKSWSVFVLANQEDSPYNPADFLEDLSKDVLSKVVGLTVAYPFKVVFLRVAAQFVYDEKIYTGLSASLREIYRSEGVKGFYGGYIPYLLSEIGALVAVWLATYAFRSVVTGDRIWLTIFRFASDYVLRSILYPFKLVSRLMAISPSPLKIAGPPHMPKFASWTACFDHLKMTNTRMRGYSIFNRVITPEEAACWNGTGFMSPGKPEHGYLPPISAPLTRFNPTSSVRPITVMEARRSGLSSFSHQHSSGYPLSSFRGLF